MNRKDDVDRSRFIVRLFISFVLHDCRQISLIKAKRRDSGKPHEHAF